MISNRAESIFENSICLDLSLDLKSSKMIEKWLRFWNLAFNIPEVIYPRQAKQAQKFNFRPTYEKCELAGTSTLFFVWTNIERISIAYELNTYMSVS